MSTPSPSLFGDASVQDWSSFLQPSEPVTAAAAAAAPAIASPGGSNQDSPAHLSTLSPSSTSTSGTRNEIGNRRSPSSSVANLLALTELRKAAWVRIYSSGLSTGDAAISTLRVPTWKQFDALMIKRHRYIAVDPRDNRTLGWIACFHPFPQLTPFYDGAHDVETGDSEDGREGGVAEIQIMVAEAERNRGVGAFLVKAILTSLMADRTYSTLQASFFPENQACQKLFERCGFQTVGTRKSAVRMLDGPTKGTWRDLVTAECKLPPLQPPTPQMQQQQQQESATGTTNGIDTTIDPNALFKRPRID